MISAGAYSAPPDSLAGFKGPTSKGREENEGGGEGKGRKREGKEKRGEGWPPILESGSASVAADLKYSPLVVHMVRFQAKKIFSLYGRQVDDEERDKDDDDDGIDEDDDDDESWSGGQRLNSEANRQISLELCTVRVSHVVCSMLH